MLNAVFTGLLLCREERADVVLVDDLLKHLNACAVSDDTHNAVLGDLAHGSDLGGHAACAEPGTLACGEVEHLGCDLVDIGDTLSVRVLAGVGIIKTVNVREDYEQIGICKDCNVGRQRVVVAESAVVHDLRCRYGVVLVDDGDYPHFEKGLDGIGNVSSCELVGDAVLGKKDLAAAVGIFGKASCISVHELALADGSDRLFLTGCGRALLEVKIADSHADSAGTYEKHFFSAVHKIGDRTAEPVYVAEVHLAVVICECRSADFDYDPFRKVDRGA